jgi:hypothetical protein
LASNGKSAVESKFPKGASEVSAMTGDVDL